jgi:ribosomal protein S18 acetylase RimI-like enzyme
VTECGENRGILIREATPGDTPGIARVKVDTWRDAYAGIVPEERLAALSYEEVEERWLEGISDPRPGAFYHVVEEEGQVVAFAAGGPERSGRKEYEGELYALYVLPEHQRQGIGRLLMRATAERLLADGVESMLLWVLAENPARAFYESLGGVLLGRKTITIGGKALEEVAYGWPDVRTLTTRV